MRNGDTAGKTVDCGSLSPASLGPELGSGVKEVAWLGCGEEKSVVETPGRVPRLLPCSLAAPHTHAPPCSAYSGLTVGPDDQGRAWAGA